MEHFLTREYLWPRTARSRRCRGRLLWKMQRPSSIVLNREHPRTVLPVWSAANSIRHCLHRLRRGTRPGLLLYYTMG